MVTSAEEVRPYCHIPFTRQATQYTMKQVTGKISWTDIPHCQKFGID
jgi:hypothetical protein